MLHPAEHILVDPNRAARANEQQHRQQQRRDGCSLALPPTEKGDERTDQRQKRKPRAGKDCKLEQTDQRGVERALTEGQQRISANAQKQTKRDHGKDQRGFRCAAGTLRFAAISLLCHEYLSLYFNL